LGTAARKKKKPEDQNSDEKYASSHTT